MARIGELDKRLEEFGRNALTSSVRLKNIEESKISARREIEDLLKVVREQQKYTEMDREMHDQLAKSWGRAEELEKKLIDFCGAVLTGQQNKGAADAVKLDREARLADDSAAGLADLKKEMTAELARTREELLALSREQAAFFKTMFEEQVKGRLDLLQSSTAAELERSRKETAEEFGRSRKETTAELERGRKETAAEFEQSRKEAASALDLSGKETASGTELFNKEFSEQMKAMRSMMEDFRRGVKENFSGAEGAAAALARNAADSAAALQQKLERIPEIIRQENDRLLSGLEERNRRHFEALNTKYADAFSNASALGFLSASSEALLKKMAVLEEPLSGLLSQSDKDRFGSALGVSGMLIRKNFEAMESLLAEIRQDTTGLERMKTEAADRVTNVFRDERK
ncbi:MAG: hypothetical protein Q8O90_04940 [Elusimicrobiota bacterium]|nr:hypothetical protein [Elusimicrobiota bacterium]